MVSTAELERSVIINVTLMSGSAESKFSATYVVYHTCCLCT